MIHAFPSAAIGAWRAISSSIQSMNTRSFALGQVGRGHVVRQPEDAHARHAGREVGIAVVDRDHMAALQFDVLGAPLRAQCGDLAAARAQVARDAVAGVFDLALVHRRFGALQVARRRVDAEPQLAHAARRQR